MRILAILLVATMMSCASARQKRVVDYRNFTKDICKDNPHEIMLAQRLYIEYVNK